MQTTLAALLALIIGMMIGMCFIDAAAQMAAAQAVRCIHDPSSCGIEGDDDLDPAEFLAPV